MQDSKGAQAASNYKYCSSIDIQDMCLNSQSDIEYKNPQKPGQHQAANCPYLYEHLGTLTDSSCQATLCSMYGIVQFRASTFRRSPAAC